MNLSVSDLEFAEAVRARQMRGALTGPADQEKPPMKYCQGKTDDNRPCRIVVLDGDFCRRHKQEIEALESGAPLPVGRVERSQEDIVKKKYVCSIEGCERQQAKNKLCYLHNKEAEAAKHGSFVELVGPKLSDMTVDAKEPETAATSRDAGIVDINTEEVDATTAQCITGDHTGDLSLVQTAIEGEAALASPPPQELVEAPASSGSRLSRLLRRLEPVTKPLPPTSMLLDFSEEEFAAIQASEVTPEEIKELALMLVNGELGKIVEGEDPCAKSRLDAGE